MPQAVVPVPQFPDVPRASGVPSVFRDPTQVVFTAILLQADIATVARFFQGPQWGIFTADGAPVAIPDSVLTVDFRREWRISDYPVEEGGFQSYDKVAVPYDARVRLSCDGNATPRALFLSQIDNAAQSLDLFTVATPDAVYTDVNIIHYDYRRAREGGVGIIQVDLWLEQVRATVKTEFTNTKQPEAAADVQTGPVQAVQPTPAQAAALPSQTPVRTASAALPVPPIPPNLLQVGPDTGASVAGLT